MNSAALVGTERTILSDATVLGAANPTTTARVTLQVRSSKDPTGDLRKSFVLDLVDQPPSKRSHLTRDAYAEQFGATPADFQHVRKFARQNRLQVVPDQLARQTMANQFGHRTMELQGTIDDLSAAFGVELVRARDENGNIYRTYHGSVHVPDEYEAVIENVFGLDTRAQAKPRVKKLKTFGGYDRGLASNTGYTPDQVAKFYNFPADVTGSGQTIALIELGGGFRARDLSAYFESLGITRPSVRAVSVGRRGKNSPSTPDSSDSEVMLDIEVVGAVAPGAKIVVYFAPNTSRGFFRAINAAVNDNSNKPTIVSMSWGGPESTWTLRDMHSMDEVFQAAAAIGLSVFAAAGDAGSTDGVPGSEAYVDFPASSPFITACGGTRLEVTVGEAVADETVWNDSPNSGTGGGISAVFSPPPKYQTGPVINLPASVNAGVAAGRGVPDIAANADPNTGYRVRVDGVDMVVGGTSAVAPLLAGLFARINQGLGRSAGFVNTLLYSVISSTPGALRDITVGDNDTTGEVGGYSAGPGWDACSGWGAPADGTLILNSLKAL